MIEGMKFPIQVGPNGGTAKVQASIAIRQNIVLALLPASSLNPWNQDLTPDENIIFDIDDAISEKDLALHIRETFKEFERAGYARLNSGFRGIDFRRTEQGVVEAHISYQDLEDGKNKTMNFPIPGGK